MKNTWLNNKCIRPASTKIAMELAAVLTTVLALSSCGPQAFAPNSVSSNQNAAGSMNIPPKVDIILGVSQNGTMQNIYSQIQPGISAFAQSLQNSGWDYRFVSIPLSQYQPTVNFPISNATTGTGFGAVAVSKYDSNYPLEQWLPPYPGANHNNPTLGILSSLFDPFFSIPAEDFTHNDGHETGIGNQVDFISRNDVKQGILRNDAVLAIITISNGDDRSGNPSAWSNTTQWYPDPNVYAQYANTLRAASSIVKYYSLVAGPSTSCYGLGSWYGKYYRQFTNLMNGNGDCFSNGTCIDICSNPVNSALASVAANLNIVKLNFRKHYLVIGTEPNPGTIQVVKTSGGSSTTLPQSASNGWTYVGLAPSNGVYAIDLPIPMDLITTGYLIELHGSAELTGNDSANVTYQNAGSAISN